MNSKSLVHLTLNVILVLWESNFIRGPMARKMKKSVMPDKIYKIINQGVLENMSVIAKIGYAGLSDTTVYIFNKANLYLHGNY